MLPILAALGTDTPSNVFYRPLAAIPASVRPRGAPALFGRHRHRREGADPAGLPAACMISCAMSICRARGKASAVGVAAGSSLVCISGAARDRLAARAGRPSRDRRRGDRAAARPLAELARRGGIRRQCAGILRGCAARSAHGLQDARGAAGFLRGAQGVRRPPAVATEFADSPQADFLIRAARAVPRRRRARAVLSARREPQRGPGAVRRYPSRSRSCRASGGVPARGDAGSSLAARRSAGAIRLAEIPPFRRRPRPSWKAGDSMRSRSARSWVCTATPKRSSRALRDQLACAAGLVVDTGVHGLGWSREQALDYLRAQVPMGEAAASAVDRVIALPGEALACGMGVREFPGSAGPRGASAGPAFRPARLSLRADR